MLDQGTNNKSNSLPSQASNGTDQKKPLGWVEKYFAVAILLCIGIGILLSQVAPSVSKAIDSVRVAGNSLPIGLCLFVMMYPAVMNLQWEELKKVVRYPKAILTTFVSNWLVAPLVNAGLAYLILPGEPQLKLAVILLGSSPCTAMVLVWGHLAGGNQEQNVVNTSLNTVSIVVLYAPIVGLLSGIQDVGVDQGTLFATAGIFIGCPLVAAVITKRVILHVKNQDWFDKVYKPLLSHISMAALLVTLIVLFALNGDVLIKYPTDLLLVSAPLLLQFVVIIGFNLVITRWLRFGYREAIITVLIGSSSHFEIAIATAIGINGVGSKTALGTTMGLFWEVPTMLSLVHFGLYLQRRGFWPESANPVEPSTADDDDPAVVVIHRQQDDQPAPLTLPASQ